MSLSLIWSDRSADHVPPPGHPERVERAHVMREVVETWRGRGGMVLEPVPASRAQIGRVHAPGYVDRLASSAGYPAVLDLDTYMSPGSWDAAVLAAGAVLTAVHHVLGSGLQTAQNVRSRGSDPIDPQDARCADLTPEGEQDVRFADLTPEGVQNVRFADLTPRAAFALVRPPGHHALRDRAMGFCLLNNVAIAVAGALDRGLTRVAVVDYDVHHGNGTQWAFYDDPRVLVISLHEHPFYPQTGSAGECGVGRGEGFTVNIPLSAGAGDADYLLMLDQVVAPVLDAFAPELLVLDAGFDAHDRDPLAHMHVSTDGFGQIAARLRDAAVRSCGGRVAVAIEGGYHLDALRGSLLATVDALGGAEGPPAASSGAPTRSGLLALELVRRTQARYWPTL
jgi:acetoin utilization deacetylase AcuC-like enzyme